MTATASWSVEDSARLYRIEGGGGIPDKATEALATPWPGVAER
jgi:hypothetical protein